LLVASHHCTQCLPLLPHCRLARAGYTILHIAAASSGLAINWNSGGGLGKMDQASKQGV